MTPVIELQDLRVKLGRREILQGISCRLGGPGGGKAIGLLGPNGAGKSTLILTLLGFHKASGGSARIFGLDCHSQSRVVKARVGYMPENDAFVADMSAVRFRVLWASCRPACPRGLEKVHEVLFHWGWESFTGLWDVFAE
jgi:ABC-2 type transport system ATP-binding protein